MKKIVAILICVLLIAGVFPMGVLAQEETPASPQTDEIITQDETGDPETQLNALEEDPPAGLEDPPPETYLVSFDGNGGTDGIDMPDQEFEVDIPAALNKNTFAYTGYRFAGWATTATGAVEYLDEDLYTLPSASVQTLFAVWTKVWTIGSTGNYLTLAAALSNASVGDGDILLLIDSATYPIPASISKAVTIETDSGVTAIISGSFTISAPVTIQKGAGDKLTFAHLPTVGRPANKSGGDVLFNDVEFAQSNKIGFSAIGSYNYDSVTLSNCDLPNGGNPPVFNPNFPGTDIFLINNEMGSISFTSITANNVTFDGNTLRGGNISTGLAGGKIDSLFITNNEFTNTPTSTQFAMSIAANGSVKNITVSGNGTSTFPASHFNFSPASGATITGAVLFKDNIFGGAELKCSPAADVPGGITIDGNASGTIVTAPSGNIGNFSIINNKCGGPITVSPTLGPIGNITIENNGSGTPNSNTINCNPSVTAGDITIKNNKNTGRVTVSPTGNVGDVTIFGNSTAPVTCAPTGTSGAINVFGDVVNGAITLGGTVNDIDVPDSVTLNAGITISGGANVTLNGGTLKRGTLITPAIVLSAGTASNPTTVKIAGTTLDGDNKVFAATANAPLILVYDYVLLELDGATLKDNKNTNFGSSRGGAINMSSTANSVVNLKNSVITGCSAYDGGAIGQTGTLNVTNSLLTKNSSLRHGGAIYGGNFGAYSNTNPANFLTITNSEISENTAGVTSLVGGGGALSLTAYKTITVKNAQIINNIAKEYGAVFIAGANVVTSADIVFDNVTVSGNVGTSQVGGMFISSCNTLTMTNSLFDKNSTTGENSGLGNYGGFGIVTAFTSVDISDTKFTRNSSVSYTGGIGINCLTGSTVSLKNVEISGNKSGYGGGMIFGGLIWNPVEGKGEDKGYPDVVTFTNVTFFNNTATIAGDDIYSRNNTPTFEYYSFTLNGKPYKMFTDQPSPNRAGHGNSAEVTSGGLLIETGYTFIDTSGLIYAPRVSATSFTINKKVLVGAEILVKPLATDRNIIYLTNLSLTGVDSDKFILANGGAENTFIINLTDAGLAAKPGKYAATLSVRTPADPAGYFFPLKLTVTDAKPAVTVKAPTINLFYPDNGYTIGLTSKSGAVSLLGIEDNAKTSGFTDSFVLVDGKLKLKLGEEGELPSPIVKVGVLKVKVNGYEEQVVPITVKVSNAVPKFAASPASYTVNKAAIKDGDTLTFAVNNTGVKPAALLNITSAAQALTDDKYTVAVVGGKIELTLVKAKIDEFTGKAISAKLNIKAEGWASAKPLTLTVNLATVTTVAKYSATSFKLNKTVLGESFAISTSTNQSNVSVSDVTVEKADGKESGIKGEFADGKVTFTLNDTEESVTPNGAYKFTLTPTFSDTTVGKAQVVTVTVISNLATLAATAKGTINYVNPDSAISYTFKLASTVDKIASVALSGTDKELFDFDFATGKITLKPLAEGAEPYTKGKTFSVGFEATLVGGQKLTSKAITIKPAQTMPKVAVVPAKPILYAGVAAINNTVNVAATPSFGSIDDAVLIDNPKLPSDLSVIWDGGKFIAKLDGTAAYKAKPGTYVFSFYVTFANQALEAATRKAPAYLKPIVVKVSCVVK